MRASSGLPFLQKLANRSEARKNVGAFSQPTFDGALQQECMSSEESDGEEPAPAGGSAETVQAFRTRGLSWRSARLLRFYQDWYRPDLMAVVAVGDFDPRRVEAMIRERGAEDAGRAVRL